MKVRMTPEEEAAFWLEVEENNPRWWIRVEVHELTELLTEYIALGLESGTPPQKVIAHLKRVRAVILNPQLQPKESP